MTLGSFGTRSTITSLWIVSQWNSPLSWYYLSRWAARIGVTWHLIRSRMLIWHHVKPWPLGTSRIFPAWHKANSLGLLTLAQPALEGFTAQPPKLTNHPNIVFRPNDDIKRENYVDIRDLRPIFIVTYTSFRIFRALFQNLKFFGFLVGGFGGWPVMPSSLILLAHRFM
jgi:hypothetical protein